MKFVALFVMLIGSAFAAEQPSTPGPAQSQAIIGGDKPIELGELVDLNVKSQLSVKDAIAFSTDWTIFDLESRQDQKFKFYRELGTETTEGVVFGAGTEPRELIVHCSITYLIVKKEDDKVIEAGTKTELIKVKIVIGGGKPRPPPAPSPVDPPKFPKERLGLSTKVYKDVMERGPPATRKVGATTLSTSFRGVQSSIAAGVLKDPVDILKKSSAANASALINAGLKREEWIPVFTSLQDELFALYEGNKIVTPADFGAAFSEIADAFDAVK